jgi:hypothetical protein
MLSSAIAAMVRPAGLDIVEAAPPHIAFLYVGRGTGRDRDADVVGDTDAPTVLRWASEVFRTSPC